ncbi:HAMP domain-containing histidine kinase [Candidatus Saccharibacteria bacterium]|nr:HAMP domain-containing histidine kinase [Candidatus Saccharibacteria bacterium]
MKVIDKAVLKLAGIYTLILLVVSIGFSVAFFGATNNELNRPIVQRAGFAQGRLSIDENESFRILMQQRDNEIRDNMLIFLIFINLGVLIFGAMASYFLARLTLKPIRRNMETQAQFVSDASHELRTPLTAMQMENEVALRDKSLDKKQLQELVKSNLEEVGKLRELTDRLLKLSLDEKPEITEIDVRELVNKTQTRWQKIADQQKIVIKNTTKSHKIQSNTELFLEILAILIDNAIKYSPRGSTVIVGSENGDVFVQDSGCGISDDDMPFIFDRFYRVEKSRVGDGFGLGLPLAKRLAEQIGFKITVESNDDTGVTFWARKV